MSRRAARVSIVHGATLEDWVCRKLRAQYHWKSGTGKFIKRLLARRFRHTREVEEIRTA